MSDKPGNTFSLGGNDHGYKPANTIPEIAALKLITIYSDGSTALVSLTHRSIIADFEYDQPQHGISHLYLSSEMDDDIGRYKFGREWNTDTMGFPGWEATFDFLIANPDILEELA